jgi:hypothetical protein
MTNKTAPSFQVKRAITLELLKPALDVPVYVLIKTPIKVGKAIVKAGEQNMEPAKVVNCTNLETGEDVQMIIPSVLNAILTEEYPDDTYVGKGFQIIKRAKTAGKRYHTFNVAELEL